VAAREVIVIWQSPGINFRDRRARPGD